MVILEYITISIVNLKNKNSLAQTTNLQTMNLQTMTRYIKNNTSNTGENLVIDESIASTIKLSDTKPSEAISSTQNPDNKNETKN